jgi:hypothetical protein
MRNTSCHFEWPLSRPAGGVNRKSILAFLETQNPFIPPFQFSVSPIALLPSFCQPFPTPLRCISLHPTKFLFRQLSPFSAFQLTFHFPAFNSLLFLLAQSALLFYSIRSNQLNQSEDKYSSIFRGHKFAPIRIIPPF